MTNSEKEKIKNQIINMIEEKKSRFTLSYDVYWEDGSDEEVLAINIFVELDTYELTASKRKSLKKQIEDELESKPYLYYKDFEGNIYCESGVEGLRLDFYESISEHQQNPIIVAENIIVAMLKNAVTIDKYKNKLISKGL